MRNEKNVSITCNFLNLSNVIYHLLTTCIIFEISNVNKLVICRLEVENLIEEQAY